MPRPSLPLYAFNRGGIYYEVHQVSVSLPQLHQLFYAYSSKLGLVRRVNTTYSLFIGDVLLEGEAALEGRYVDELIRHAVGEWWVCAAAFKPAPNGELQLVAVVPLEYLRERSLYALS
ncbi:MAG: hypothetical protein KA604_03210 [Candidatus Saccharimonas sp.]|nr:hypothetical protein [Candidatus Saccharimonas sp.]